MPELITILKVVGIAAALILVRFVIQALLHRHLLHKHHGKFEWFSKNLLPFCIPPLITGGPMFIAMAASLFAIQTESVPVLFVFMAFGGGLGLMFGLMAIFSLVMQQQRKIQHLESLLTVDDGHSSGE